MKMPTNTRDLYARYVETNLEVKRLNADLAEMKNAIIEHLGDQKAAVEFGFAVKLTPGTRRTLNAALVAEKLNIQIPDECYKHTSYDSLSVTPIKA